MDSYPWAGQSHGGEHGRRRPDDCGWRADQGRSVAHGRDSSTPTRGPSCVR